MESPAGFGIAANFPTTFHLAGQLKVVLDVVLEIVGIDEVFPSVVGRVDVYELHLPSVGFPEELEDLKIVALDHEVVGGSPVHAFLRARTQGARAGSEGELTCAT